MSTWINEDGLQVLFALSDGAEVIKNGKASGSIVNTFVHKFDYTDVADTDVTVPNANESFIPAGAIITKAWLYVTDPFVGATAVLDIGLKNAAGVNTDDQGIDAGILVAALDALGDTILCDGVYVIDGDTTALRIAADQYVMTTWDTAAFTAGAATLVVEYLDLEA